jgi:uncharacterized protein
VSLPAQLNVVTLGARDLDKLRAFYAGLGWPLAVSLDDFAAFETRGAVLCLFPVERLAEDARTQQAAHQPGMRGFSLAINVDRREQVDETIAAVRAADGRITKEPIDATEFEGRSAYFADPEDNYWEVVWLAPGSIVAATAARAMGSADPPAAP